MNPRLLRNFALKVGSDDPRVTSFVRYFASHCKKREEFKFGLEIEHLITNAETGVAIGFSDANAVLSDFANYFEEQNIQYTKEISDGHLIGLFTDGISITLEPGSQFEFSVGAFDTTAKLQEKYNEYRDLLDGFVVKRGLNVQTIGYQPKSKQNEISLIPKSRYYAMDEYLSKTGKYGHNMMRCSASTQLSIDYESEQDCINKLRIAEILGPILCYIFTNTPYFEGEPNPYAIARVMMWDDLDQTRCGSIPGLFDPDFSLELFAKYALSAPLMVANLTKTPEAQEITNAINTQNAAIFATTLSASEIYPKRSLNDFEIEHILSTFFFDVRLKGYVELRTCDSLPINRAIEYADMIERNFYNTEKLQFWVEHFRNITELDITVAKKEIQLHGENAVIYGENIGQWKEQL